MENGKNRTYCGHPANPVRFHDSLKVQIQNQRSADGQIPSRDDYTGVVFWYQEGAHGMMLQPFAERTAPSQAIEYGK